MPLQNMARFTYVYILQSQTHLERVYTGRTLDLRARLGRHNQGMVPHTAKWRPWVRQNLYCALKCSAAVERSAGRSRSQPLAKPDGIRATTLF